MTSLFRAGTRGSALALCQTEMVLAALRQNFSENSFEYITIATTGDKRQGTPEASTLDKKAWIRELEQAILAKEVDFAIHSGKDVPFDIEDGTALIPVLERAQPADCFIGKLLENGSRLRFEDLSPGAMVGTASLRRAASLLKLRPDLKITEHRGNVPTRIRKLDEDQSLSGIVLACAGIDRLAEVSVAYEAFNVHEFLPALAQGTLVAQYRQGHSDVLEMLQRLCPPALQASYVAERACAERLRVNCHSVLGVYAWYADSLLHLRGRVLSQDGSISIDAHLSQLADRDPRKLGLAVAENLLSQGAEQYL